MKKYLCVILTILALALTGCNNASGITEPTTQPTKPVATTPAPTTPPTTPAPTEPTTAEPVDEIALLRTTFEIAEKDQGVFLIRDDKIYTLNDKGGKVPGVEYSDIQVKEQGSVWFYRHSRHSDESLSGYHYSIGEVPVPTLTDGDKIIAFSNNFFDLELAPANFVGYSFYLIKRDGEYLGYDENGAYFSIMSKKLEFTITDEKENVIEDYSSLEKDGTYTLSWYEGTKYNEIKLAAIYRQFDYNYKDKSDHLFVSGVLTKNGYAEYDLSGIPAGLYVIKLNDGLGSHGGLIEIK